MSSSSLSSVVSNLVRASMGSAVSGTVTDDELDRHVAELILKEAKQKAERYLNDGVRAYLPDKEPDSNLPRANKRFLSNIIRNTDDHNKAILRAQAEAAREAKVERDEQERRDMRARAQEATETGRMMRLMGNSLRRDEGSWDRRREKDRDSGRRRRSRDRTLEVDEERSKGRHYARSRSPIHKDDDSSRRRRRRHDSINSDKEDGRSNKHRRRSRSPGHERHRSSRKRSRSGSRRHARREDSPRESTRSSGKGKDKEVDEPAATATPPFLSSSRTSAQGTPKKGAYDEEPLETTKSLRKHSHSPSQNASRSDLSSQFKSRKTIRASPPPPASPTLSEEEDIERLRPRRKRRRSPSPDPLQTEGSHGRSAPKTLPSKMDKYFEESYDPRLDTGPMTLPNIPSTGLLDSAEFESWEAMLDIIRQRREDKIDRKRMERLGLLSDKKSKEKATKEEKSSEAWTMDSGIGVMDIKYSKKGAVREWDMGKEGF